MKSKHHSSVLLLLSLSTACDSKAPGVDAHASETQAAKTGATDASQSKSVQPSAAATAAVTTLREYDLGAAGPAWSGWVVTAPMGAKVTKAAFGGAVVSNQLFDVALDRGKTSFEEMKAGFDREAKSKLPYRSTLTLDQPDMIEWTVKEGRSTKYLFMKHTQAAGEDITCRNTKGTVSERARKRLQDVCQTLAKK